MSLYHEELLCFFFFSSRRRHTRCSRDWSSDVCSSDLRESGPRFARNDGSVLGSSGVPGDAGQLFLARFPLGAGEEARGDIDQAWSEFEDARGGPWPAVTGTILADVQGIRHTGKREDRKSTRLNSSHGYISYAVFCLKKKKK